MTFDQILPIDLGNYQRPIPLTNSFGRLFPTMNDGVFAQLLQIGPQDRVLDIGGGSNPFQRANVVTEAFPDDPSQRSGRAVPADVEMVTCFAEDLPFADRSFDFAISRQVFEHTTEPAKACREIMRVARRGFIETPQKVLELLAGTNPSHNWFVSVQGGVLVFERRRFIRHPFRNPILSGVASTTEGQLLIHLELKNLSNVQFYWEGRFDFEVIDHPDGFDYANPDHAAEAHLDVAICGLKHGGYFLADRENDARSAVKRRPGWALAHNTLGVILWRQNRFFDALQSFRTAAELAPRREFAHNARLVPGMQPILVDFEDTLPMDEAYFASMRQPDGIDMFALLRPARGVQGVTSTSG